MNGIACAALRPLRARSEPSAKITTPPNQLQRPCVRRAGSGRFRTAVTMLSTLTRHAETATTRNVRNTPSVYAITTLDHFTAN